ncbi:aldehyde dehydrogenase family protein [Helicobacter sp. MIT 03-1614]|nr:aldehyde dehydrogenase family protein [Helicobacter sp. MIT 03-1614]
MQEIIQESLDFAADLQEKINTSIRSREKAFHFKMQKLLNDPKAKVMLIELLDRSFRSKEAKTSFEFIEYSLNKYGIPDFFSAFEKFLLFAFLHFGKFTPHLSVPFFIRHLRNDTKSMVLDANEAQLTSHILARKNQSNIILNVNLIGEEVLGEIESKYRIKKYEEAIKSNYITYISIKITTIFSQINIIDFDYSKAEIVKRLENLYALALEEEQRQNQPKFINLDMEEFRDLELTVAAFMESIAQFDIKAGIVLQAYLPDSYEYLKKLYAFSKERVLKGMKPIKIRFVKGANMESEALIASQRGWAMPTFDKKIDTDSNYNKMLDFVLEDDNYKFIHIGIASHNIFEIAYAYIRIKRANALDSFTFEQLEGMSMQCSLELSKIHQLILYAPVCDESHFNNAIAYLVRRLDENTSEDNFMRHFFGLKVGDKAWNVQKELFLASLKGIKNLDNSTHRIQDRNNVPKEQSSYQSGVFKNEPDTDFILAQNRVWAQKIRVKYENLRDIKLYPVAGELDFTHKKLKNVEQKDKINNQTIAHIYLAGENEIKESLKVALSANENLSFDNLYEILSSTAQLMRERRGDLIGIAALEVGKTFLELDSEVSEAIDFLEFYPYSLKELRRTNPKTRFSPKGVGLVIAPWNFPIGISVGSISSMLASGNVVIYKPSSLSVLSGYEICKCFWDAGISKNRLIFLPAKGSDISKYLLNTDEIKACVLTGGEETAYTMLKTNPTLWLSAETGGKNATIVTKMADRDQAVKNIIHSAFSNSGQKCSATSLLVLEKEVYEDEEFKKCLIDAASSLAIGSPFEFKNKLGALADKPSDKVKKALKEIAPYEHWVLEAKFINKNEHLMSPAIKYGTKKGDFTHTNELFAPILSVMKAQNLEEAIDIVNSTGYGLTAGLESLDEREWEYFHTHIEAGNIYINKPTTGAIVLRQPFGGVKKSAIGFGRKVGIYNYVTQFLHISQDEADMNVKENVLSKTLAELSLKLDSHLKAELQKAILMAKSYTYHYENEFSQSKDYVQIRGEDNLFSYTPIKSLALRISADDSLSDILSVLIAGKISGVRVYLSYEKNENLDFIQKELRIFEFESKKENEFEFSKTIANFERIFYYGKPDRQNPIYQQAALNAKIIKRDKPLINGHFELLYYFNEKSLSISYHRYGNLGARVLK